MAPVMGALYRLSIWAARLYDPYYFPQLYPPATSVDYTRAAVVFGFSALFPILVGLGAAVVAYRRKHTALWPSVELCIISPLLLLYCLAIISNSQQGGAAWPSHFLWPCFSISFFAFGGTIVTSLLNLGACVIHRKWGLFALSFLTFLGAALPTLLMYVAVIYFNQSIGLR
jgi:hypothetical protein